MDNSKNDKLVFLWNVHTYTNDYIRFADQKAGIVLAIQSGLLATLSSGKHHAACSLSRLAPPTEASLLYTSLGIVTFLSFFFLLLGIFSSLMAILPRLWNQFRTSLRERILNRVFATHIKGAIFWKDILAHADEEKYREYIDTLDEDRQVKEIARHLHVLAGVANAKFGWITISFGFGAIGVLFSLITLYFG